MSSQTDQEGPSKKRAKTNVSGGAVFTLFHTDFLLKYPNFLKAVDAFKEEIMALGAFEIGSCNGADPDNGYSFAKANCTLRPTKCKLAFANFFIEGFKTLKNFIRRMEIPRDDKQKMALQRLLTFLLNEETQKQLEEIRDCSDQTELTVLLACHLFRPLSTSPSFTMDNTKSNQQKFCPCKTRHGEISFSDTSIGYKDVWHGHLDLIMEGADVIVDTFDSYSEFNKDSAEEVKSKHFDLSDNSSGSNIAQLAAKTIVYSFYHRSLHPDVGHTLIPSIGITTSGLVFYFYDSINDVFLGSTCYPLASTSPFQLNWRAIIAVWLVLNHQHFCNGLTETDLTEAPKANFLTIAKDKIDIYRNELKRGNVGTRWFQETYLDPVSFVNAKFFVSPEL